MSGKARRYSPERHVFGPGKGSIKGIGGVFRRLAGSSWSLLFFAVNLLGPIASAGGLPVAVVPPEPEAVAGQESAVVTQSVDDLIAMALRDSPGIAVLRSRLAAAEAEITARGALPDPSISLMYQDVGFPRDTVGREEMSMVSLKLSQGIYWPGKRALRREVARAESEVARIELLSLRREVIRDVRIAYAQLYRLDQELAALQVTREMLLTLAESVRNREVAGDTDQTAVLKAQLNVFELDSRIDDVRTDRDVVWSGLCRILDRPVTPRLSEVIALPGVTFPEGSLDDQALAGSLEIIARRAELTAGEADLAMLRLETRPDFSLDAATGYRDHLDAVVTLGLEIDLPVWKKSKQDLAVKAAEIRVEAARQEVRRGESLVRSETARLQAEWTRDKRQVARVTEAILPHARATLESSRSSYLSGHGDFPGLIDDFQAWLAATIDLHRREADLFMTWAEVQLLITPLESDERMVAGQ